MGEVEALYRQWGARPPVEVVLASYFKLPALGDDDPIDEEMMLTPDEAMHHFMLMGFAA